MSMALEAVAINYLSHTVWAWIAFVTAALSVWKIKWSSSSSSSPSSTPSPSPALPASASASASASAAELETSAEAEADPDEGEVAWTKTTFCTLENRRSGKFRAYYYGEDDKEAGSNEELFRKRTRKGSHERFGWSWEALLKLKTAEMGYCYRYQDLTMLDGSVVQLWNPTNSITMY